MSPSYCHCCDPEWGFGELIAGETYAQHDDGDNNIVRYRTGVKIVSLTMDRFVRST